MAPKRYPAFQALIQKLAATPLGSWLLAHGLRRVDRFIVRISRGRTSLTSMLAGVPVVMVTTTGARSGQPRTSPLLPVYDPAGDSRFALIASNWGKHRLPSWYFNLKKNPQATVAADGRARSYVAREVGGEEYDRFWGYAVDTYFGYALYKQRAKRRIPIVVLDKD